MSKDKAYFKNILDKSIDDIINLKNFDIQSFTYNFRTYSNKMKLFHNIIGNKANSYNELTKIQYKLRSNPHIGQVAYFCLENSYPKEIYNAHWCFIIKDFGTTYLVAPTVSIKDDSKEIDGTTEILVKLKGLNKSEYNRIKINQLMCLDKLRIEENKGYYDIEEDVQNIISEIISKII